MTVLYTVGHGTLPQGGLGQLLQTAGIRVLVDVRRFPGSRRHPHTNRGALERWLPDGGVDYRWEEALGGRREPDPASPNLGIRDDAMRGYADHLATDEFRHALDRVLAAAADTHTAVMCAESDWRRCHRRFVADAATLLRHVEVRHLRHDGTTEPHQVTDGARRGADGIVYDPARSAQQTLFEP